LKHFRWTKLLLDGVGPSERERERGVSRVMRRERDRRSQELGNKQHWNGRGRQTGVRMVVSRISRFLFVRRVCE